MFDLFKKDCNSAADVVSAVKVHMTELNKALQLMKVGTAEVKDELAKGVAKTLPTGAAEVKDEMAMGVAKTLPTVAKKESLATGSGKALSTAAKKVDTEVV